MWDRIQGRFVRDGQVLLGQVEGEVGRQDGELRAWCGHLVVPRDRLDDVAGVTGLWLDLVEGRGFPIALDPAAAGVAPEVVVAFRCPSPVPGGR